jgi:hypothetical protein
MQMMAIIKIENMVQGFSWGILNFALKDFNQ